MVLHCLHKINVHNANDKIQLTKQANVCQSHKRGKRGRERERKRERKIKTRTILET